MQTEERAPGSGKEEVFMRSPECPQGESEVAPGNLYLLHPCLAVCLEVTETLVFHL